jgi:hypothetical protein
MDGESIFAAALAKGDAAERQAFQDQACAGDLALRQRVEQMLAADLWRAWTLRPVVSGPHLRATRSLLLTRPSAPAASRCQSIWLLAGGGCVLAGLPRHCCSRATTTGESRGKPPSASSKD